MKCLKCNIEMKLYEKYERGRYEHEELYCPECGSRALNKKVRKLPNVVKKR